MNSICIAIPARYHSTRLPGKPLLKIENKTIIEHVYRNALRINGISDKNIIILTDDKRIHKEVTRFGGRCYISKQECPNGTARIQDYIQETALDADFIINIQGDEPFFDIQKIEELIELFKEEHSKNNVKCGTLYYTTNDEEYAGSKNKVKLVLNQKNYIMYGSRQLIPGSKKKEDITYHIHIGIFIFEKDFFMNPPTNTSYQLIEDLEWLSIIETDQKIIACPVNYHERGVDTMEDYEYLKQKFTS